MKTKQDVVETMKESIAAQIDGNRQHGWGQTDSMEVINDLLSEFAPTWAEPQSEDRKAVIEAVLAGINQLVNPSACRQWLESKDQLAKSEGRKSKSNKLFADF